MTMTEVVLAVQQSNPDKVQFRFRTRTSPKLTKKNRTTKEPTAFSVAIESEFKAKLGANYQDEVNEALEKLGRETGFVAQKPAGKHYVNGTNWLLESDTEPGKYYVALSCFSERTAKYLVDGAEATPERVADLKANYLPKAPTTPALVPWKTYSVESILAVEAVA